MCTELGILGPDLADALLGVHHVEEDEQAFHLLLVQLFLKRANHRSVCSTLLKLNVTNFSVLVPNGNEIIDSLIDFLGEVEANANNTVSPTESTTG